MTEEVQQVNYVGELYQVKSTATGFKAQQIVPDDVDSAKVTIFNKLGVVEVAETDMEWDADDEFWFYNWPATVDQQAGPSAVPVAAGKYKAQVEIFDTDGHKITEYTDIVLKKRPV